MLHTFKMNQTLHYLEQGLSANALFIYLSFLLFLLVLIKFNKPGSTKYHNLPPSPSKLPVIGNLHQLFGDAAHRAYHSLAQKHGPLMFLQLGSIPTVVVSSAELAQHVMKTYDHVFSSRPQLMFPARISYDKKDVAFAPYGEYWRQVRKVCVVRLLNAKKVQSFRASREEEIALMLEKIEKICLSESVVNWSVMAVSLTNDNVCRIAFGRKYNEGERGKRFKKIMNELTYLLGAFNIGDFIPSLGWLNYLNGLYSRLDKCVQAVDIFLDEVIEDHIEKSKRSGGGERDDDDFVDIMLRTEKDLNLGVPFERDSTKGVVLDMFTAGTDTSAISIDWSMSELLRHPEIMKEVQKEVRDVAKGRLVLKEKDIEEMPYLKAVIKETLRLHPPLPLLVPRETMEDINLQGYDIPAKTRVIINAYAIGRDPLSWEEPEKFWPKRFLNNGSSALIDFKGQDFQLIPFGAGRRGCPGANFAIPVIELTLANLLNRFDWALPNGMHPKDLDMQEGFGSTIFRKVELVLVAKPHYH